MKALWILCAFVIVVALAKWSSQPEKPIYACLGPFWDRATPKDLKWCRDAAKTMHFETTKP